jgi:hypothetical protein
MENGSKIKIDELVKSLILHTPQAILGFMTRLLMIGAIEPFSDRRNRATS